MENTMKLLSLYGCIIAVILPLVATTANAHEKLISERAPISMTAVISGGPYDYLYSADRERFLAKVMEEKHQTVVPGDAIQWGPAPPFLPPGAQVAVLLGDPGKGGPFVLRLKFPAGFLVPPHTHSKDEFLTLLSGSVSIPPGETVDRTALKDLPPGSVIHLPAGLPHYLWAMEESIVQLNGVGPFDIKYIDPEDDPRKGS
jgi:quercetin dioxygenase-like cupin family protein